MRLVSQKESFLPNQYILTTHLFDCKPGAKRRATQSDFKRCPEISLVAIEERVHPTPFRTRKLSSPSPMILHNVMWESRPLPKIARKPLAAQSARGFLFLRLRCCLLLEGEGEPFGWRTKGSPSPSNSPIPSQTRFIQEDGRRGAAVAFLLPDVPREGIF